MGIFKMAAVTMDTVTVMVSSDTESMDGCHHDGSAVEYEENRGVRARVSKGLSGTTVSLSLASTGGIQGTSILALKQAIRAALGHERCTEEHQTLIWGGVELGYNKQEGRFEEERTLGSYLPSGMQDRAGAGAGNPVRILLVLQRPRIHILVSLVGKPEFVVVKPFDPGELPSNLKEWFVFQYYEDCAADAPAFKPIRYNGRELDNTVAIGDQGLARGNVVRLDQLEL
jgi:hypothetical protein